MRLPPTIVLLAMGAISCGSSRGSAPPTGGSRADGGRDDPPADAAPRPTDAAARPADVAASTADAAPDAGGDLSAPAGWELVWSDEFDGPDGTPPDFTGKWTADLGWGEGGWGNNELQSYTDRPENIVQRGGNLVISARQDNVAGQTCGGKPCQYTSARIHTKGKFEQQYGRFEARLEVPSGSRMWPAFWMMGNDFPRPSAWPFCGEIDVMEVWGYDPGISAGTTHDPGDGRDTAYQDTGLSGQYRLANGGKFADDFHVFAVEWEVDVIRFSVDRVAYHCVVTAAAPPGAVGTSGRPRCPPKGSGCSIIPSSCC